ncbi:MAG TPA: leucyl aminopeptidase [Myxococcota bacterium]|nr:leucyl aminopeptidase [Myxococcota bacterium]
MEIEVSRRDAAAAEGDAVVIPLTKSDAPPRALAELDAALGGICARVWAAGDFTGKSGEVLSLPVSGIAAKRLVLIGLGEERSASRESLRAAGGRAAKTLARAKAKRAALAVPALRRIQPEDAGQALAEGLVLGAYRFDKYKTGGDAPAPLEHATLLAADARQVAALRRGANLGRVVAEAANFARDLSNEPGGVCTPEHLASEARKLARSRKLGITVFAERELAREKMAGILAVGRGSANPPRLIALEYGAPPRAKKGARVRKRPTLAFVGKGITFDSGGISIKPAASMDEMKHDMSGGAAVLGALQAIADLGLPVHAIGIVAAAQNMPDGNAYVPGDVIKSAHGKTIEVLNTDAEGRIVLSDALHYAVSHKPDAIVDLATLTGACLVALGDACCAVLGNDEKLADKVRDSGDATHERAWPLPLWDEHKNAIKGTFGDIVNTGGRNAGVSTAAAFLSNFVGDVPWAHLDIAGVAWTTKETPYYAKGATGFGVRLLVDLARRWK